MKTRINTGKSIAANKGICRKTSWILLLIVIFNASVIVPQLFGESQKNLEGAIYWKNGKAMFFKGNRYIRYDISTDRSDAGYPKSIDNGTWPGLPMLFK